MHRPTRTHVACHMHGESRFIGPNEVPNRPLRRRRADTPPCWHAAPAHRTLPCLASPANLAALLKLLNEGITVRLAAPYRGGVQPAYLCAICQCVHTTPTTDTQTSPTRLQRWDLPRITPHAVASPRASKHADAHVHRGVLVRSPTARDGHPHRRDLRALLKAGAPRQAGGHRGAASACMPHGRGRVAAHSSPHRPSKPLRATQAESPARMSSMSSEPCISILPCTPGTC